ncbi:hypothetical protein GCK72_022124 [Caenorhabditis remanei]|uniref:Uncharacterized protein n=1 Tax=Caenorhabditis remanei TaxID=31234 RepID=A0A6A5FSX3_CAERE|nr:hypothetical protein GCK72_022124 [Caenorhabditis remanei]KAF1745677.1 hypothetical protein GCK72_022124 [Caenorhabditis remanei]
MGRGKSGYAVREKKETCAPKRPRFPFGGNQRHRAYPANFCPGEAGPSNGMKQYIWRQNVLENHRRANDFPDFEMGNPSHLFALKKEAEEQAALLKAETEKRSVSTQVDENSFSEEHTLPVTDQAASTNPTLRPESTLGNSIGSVNPSNAESFDDQDMIIMESSSTQMNTQGATVPPSGESWPQQIKNREKFPSILVSSSSNEHALSTPNTESDSTEIRFESNSVRQASGRAQKRKNQKRRRCLLDHCSGFPRRKSSEMKGDPDGLQTNFGKQFITDKKGELQKLLKELDTKIYEVMREETKEENMKKTKLIEELSQILERSRQDGAEKVVQEITPDEEMDESNIELGPWEEDWKCKAPTNGRVPYSEFGEEDWERIRKEVRYEDSGRPVQAEASREGFAYKYTASYRCLETVPEKIEEITEKFTRPYRSIKFSYKIKQGFYSGVELETTSIASITFTLKTTPTVFIRFSENLPSQSFELRLFKEVSLVPPLCPGFPSCLILTPIKNAEGMIFRQMEKLSPRFEKLKAVMRIGNIPMTVSKPLFFVLKSEPLEPETDCTVNVLSDSRFSSQISAVAGFIIMSSNFPLHVRRLKMNYLTDNTFWDTVSSLGLVWVFLAHQGGPRGWRLMSRDSIPVRCTSNFVEWSDKPNRIYPLYPPIHPFRPLQIETNLNWDDSFNPGKPFPSIPATSVLLPDISMLNCDGSGPSTSRPPRAHGDSANEDSTPQPPETSPELPSPDFFSVPRREENGKKIPAVSAHATQIPLPFRPSSNLTFDFTSLLQHKILHLHQLGKNYSNHTRKHLNTIGGEKDPVAMKSPEMSSSEMQREHGVEVVGDAVEVLDSAGG